MSRVRSAIGRLLTIEEIEQPPSVSAVVMEAMRQDRVETIMPALPAIERESQNWHVREHQQSTKRWELLYLLLGLLFGGGVGGGIAAGFSQGKQAVSHDVVSRDVDGERDD